MMETICSISVFSADYTHIGEELKKIKESRADMIHIDVMDGSFVELYGINQLWMEEIHRNCERPMDVHFMTAVNEKKIQQFDKDYVKTLLFHPEAMPENEFLRALWYGKARKKQVGIVLSPNTEAERIIPCLPDVDEVLIMTALPGKAGSVYLPEMIHKIRKVREIKRKTARNIRISVDGGLTLEAAQDCIGAGVDKLIIGRCFYHSPNIIEALKSAKNL